MAAVRAQFGFSIVLLMTFVALTMLSVHQAEEAHGATIVVPDDEPTIQDAIVNATDWDTVLVRDGTYHEQVVVWRPVVLKGESRDGTVIVNSGDCTLLVVAHKTRVSNLTLITSWDNAALIVQSYYCVIEDVVCTDSGYGIWVDRTGHCLLRNVISQANTWRGLHVQDSDHNTFVNVTCMGNGEWGLTISSGTGNTFRSCSFVDNVIHGIATERTPGREVGTVLLFTECVMSRNGQNGCDVATYDSVTIEGCTIDGNGWSGVQIMSSNDTVVRGCTVTNFTRIGIGYSGAWDASGGVIEGCYVEPGNSSWTSVFARRTEGCCIVNNTIRSYNPAIAVYSANNTVVEGNTLLGQDEDPEAVINGITIGRPPNGVGVPPVGVVVRGNTIRGFAYGIYVRASVGLVISDCNITSRDWGIVFDVIQPEDPPMVGGQVEGCTLEGGGLMIKGMTDALVEANLVHRARVGVLINATTQPVDGNVFSNNVFLDCQEYGLYFEATNGTNLFHLNTFIDNAVHSSTPDPGDSFDNGTYGNYWDDYEERYPDATLDGTVWDTPYAVNGSAALDHYPIGYQWDVWPPVADAGPDVTALAGETVVLSGSGSWDEIGVVDYAWRWTYEGSSQLLTGEEVELVFRWVGTYEVTLVVRDGWGNVGTDTVVVEIYDDEPPAAVAGENLTTGIGEAFTLNASLSSDNGMLVGYSWVVDPDGMAIALSGITVIHAIGAPGVYDVVLRVVDEAGNWDEDWLVLTVRDSEPPAADAGEDVTLSRAGSVLLDGSGSSDNIRVVNWTWSYNSYSGAIILGGERPEHSFTEGTWVVTLTVYDAAGNLATDNVTVTVLGDVTPPVAYAGMDQVVPEGTMLTLDATGSTDDRGIAVYTWTVRWGTDVETLWGPTPQFTFLMVGIYNITLQVEDAVGNAGTDWLDIIVVGPTERAWRLGPFLDDKGDPVASARVEVELRGVTYVGRTDDDGMLELTVALSDLVSPAKVRAEKEGWKDLEFEMPLKAQGDPSGAVPSMARRPAASEEQEVNYLPWVLLVVMMLAFLATILYLSASSR